MSGYRIRPAEPPDVPEIVAMVAELAEYERARHEVELTEGSLREALFAPHPAVFAHVAADGDDRPVGIALWFLNFSTWTGRHGIYLEDLYVRPAHRGAGLGRRLLVELARICVGHGYLRLEWSVLDWNEPALAFYRSLGAAGMDEWTGYRLAGPELRALGATAELAGVPMPDMPGAGTPH
ncbi:MAG: GNAT family N-acetyltransferase [Actinobacteria bacterium]|nr:GNAT family N-acetyltransferase [Actinomycetota bacterium]MBI3686633.1 GNAT family N-acetyltransferase [Actinomycetota bacterium]